MRSINSPLFSFTSDIDWASDYCIRDLSDLLVSYKIKPTLFVTHDTSILNDLAAAGKAELGVHPNFASGSSHGNSIEEVIDTVFRLVPSAETYRAHRFADSTTIALEMPKILPIDGFWQSSNPDCADLPEWMGSSARDQSALCLRCSQTCDKTTVYWQSPPTP